MNERSFVAYLDAAELPDVETEALKRRGLSFEDVKRQLLDALDDLSAQATKDRELFWFDELVDELSHDEQYSYLKPLATILSAEDCELGLDDGQITLTSKGRKYELVVEPGLKKATPNSGGRVYVSEALLKYTKPAALDAILVGVGAKSEDARF